MAGAFRSGFVAIIGRPNVGKSTLLNTLLGQKIAIVSGRQQTTRNRITGIKTLENAQIIFVDTPGIHEPRHALGEAMVTTARKAIEDIDVVLFVTDAERDDSQVIELLKKVSKPVVFVLDKADKRTPAEVSGIMQEYSHFFPFSASVPVSGLKAKGIDTLIDKLLEFLPAGPKYYDDDMITDQYERFMAEEIIREKIIRNTSEEVPHSVVVEVQEWKEGRGGLISIKADIYVERDGQKGIIIGNKGDMLKKIGQQSRQDIERLLDAKVFLELWVKVRKGWRDNKKMLQTFGYR